MSVLAKILLATDGSEEAVLAARAARDLAEKTGAELHVVYVGELPMIYHPEQHGYHNLLESYREQARQRLDEQVERIGRTGDGVARSHLRMGRPDEEIVAVAEDVGAGMIVLGNRGLGGVRRALLGSVSESVVCHAHCPVLVVRDAAGVGERELFPTKILAATDGSGGSALAVREAADLAAATGSELHVAHVLPAHMLYSSADMVLAGGISIPEEDRREAERVLDEGVEEAREAGLESVEGHLLKGKPDRELVSLAEKLGAGLIVVGSRGLGALARALMGSTSLSIIRHAHCPVLVVREEREEVEG